MSHQLFSSLTEAFLAHVHIDDLSQCWPWIGPVSGSGYGQLSYQSHHYFSNQLAFRLLCGPIIHRDVGLVCGNKLCCNPTHLFNAPHDIAVKYGLGIQSVPIDPKFLAQLRQQFKEWKQKQLAEWRAQEAARKAALHKPRIPLTFEQIAAREVVRRAKRKAYYARRDVLDRKYAWRKQYYKTEKGKAAQSSYRKDYYQRDNVRARRKRYAQSEKAKIRQKASRKRFFSTVKGKLHRRRKNVARRIRKKGGFVSKIENERIAQWEARWRRKYKVRCYWCRKLYRPRDCHTDHIVALANGGKHIMANVCIACFNCNVTKGAKSLPTWSITTFGQGRFL